MLIVLVVGIFLVSGCAKYKLAPEESNHVTEEELISVLSGLKSEYGNNYEKCEETPSTILVVFCENNTLKKERCNLKPVCTEINLSQFGGSAAHSTFQARIKSILEKSNDESLDLTTSFTNQQKECLYYADWYYNGVIIFKFNCDLNNFVFDNFHNKNNQDLQVLTSFNFLTYVKEGNIFYHKVVYLGKPSWIPKSNFYYEIVDEKTVDVGNDGIKERLILLNEWDTNANFKKVLVLLNDKNEFLGWLSLDLWDDTSKINY